MLAAGGGASAADPTAEATPLLWSRVAHLEARLDEAHRSYEDRLRQYEERLEACERRFEDMARRGVGEALALFWVSRAFVAEKAKAFAEADAFYARGVALQARMPCRVLGGRREMPTEANRSSSASRRSAFVRTRK